jgi:hypothetical protein
MNMMKFIFLYLLCCFFFTLHVNAQEPLTLRINPDDAEGGPASRYIKKVTYIPLETNKESTLPFISSLTLSKNYYAIYDMESYVIMLFTKEGKYHSKIKLDSSLTKEETYPLNIYIHEKEGLIEIPAKPETFFYDFSGKLIKKTATVKPMYHNDMYKAMLSGGYEIHFNTVRKLLLDTVKYELLVYDSTGRTVQKFLSYPAGYIINSAERYGNLVKAYDENDSTAYFTRLYDYGVYEVGPSHFKQLYRFLFPLNISLPINFRNNPAYSKKREEFIYEHRDFVEYIRFEALKNDKLFFGLKNLYYIYDIKTGRLVCRDKILPDSISYYLPTCLDQTQSIAYGGMVRNGLDFDGTCFYGYADASVLFKYQKENEAKKITYPPELEAFFKNKKNRGANPVLIKIEFNPLFE